MRIAKSYGPALSRMKDVSETGQHRRFMSNLCMQQKPAFDEEQSTQLEFENFGVGISFYPDEEDGDNQLLRVHAVAPYTYAKQSGIQVCKSSTNFTFRE